MMEHKKMKRPNIPAAIQMELWIKSGGRCEFKGCNKYLYKDGVTKQPRNLANIAHIISWTPNGPRGNEDSEKLAKDISNLMLTCAEHNNLIDDPKYVNEYPVELLQKYKREHEERIFRVTGMGQDYGVRIVKMWSKIQNQVPQITEQSIYQAIQPFYPLDEPLNIDLTQVEDITEAIRQIQKIVDLHLLSEHKQEKYDVFIMSKIPYACCLGYTLGNKIHADTYQYFRDSQDWKWRDVEGGHFHIVKPDTTKMCSDVNLLLEVSGIIDLALIPNNISYHIKADNPGFLFLQSKKQVIEFQIKFREILSFIRETHGENIKVHLFPAVSNPIAFEIGRSIMKNIDPTIILYDKTEQGTDYEQIMVLHERIRKQVQYMN